MEHSGQTIRPISGTCRFSTWTAAKGAGNAAAARRTNYLTADRCGSQQQRASDQHRPCAALVVFELVESGLKGTPIDLIRLGAPYIHRGNWNGRELVPSQWVIEGGRGEAGPAAR
jgi:CubicO group peptidase (beta-lactamase class C family)